jgi:cytochrome d ubiquinol oxidase subunit II
MATLWYLLIAVMLAVYVVLDGFDFGAGILHLFVAKTDDERRTVFSSIGPFWDGNEVWLLAAGGTIVFAFPHAYASGFSGFYLPLMMVLWLLVGRALSIEFRSKEANPLWRSFWDGIFFISSTLKAIVLGAALGNLIRGVPIDATGYFSGPLFTNFQPGPRAGVLDWYTVLVGVLTLLILAEHGALYLAFKTSGEVNRRAGAIAKGLWPALIVVGILATIATAKVQPLIVANALHRPWIWPLVALVFASVAFLMVCHTRGKEFLAFLASAVTIAVMLASAVLAAYPYILISTLNPAWSLTVHNSASGESTLRIGLYWWPFALLIVIGYFTMLFKSFRGKVDIATDHYGH